MSSKWKKEHIQLQYQIIRVVDSSPVLRIITILGFISLNIFNIAGRRALRNTSSEFQLLIKIDVEQNLEPTRLDIKHVVGQTYAARKVKRLESTHNSDVIYLV
ncbi:Hypothetical_protein [Hexamita inflata]|uniref:Hypothetical_protein n=1 Tax=Hexamita inflata TaxID=28002 RepID=A0AA86QX51_9EUKA|nr:Hypothetical protein HINF_LOCUS50032 [Hexamita inflata]